MRQHQHDSVFRTVLLVMSAWMGAGVFAAEGSQGVGNASAKPVKLVNPDFESGTLHEGWTLHIYGARPTVATDTGVYHSGRQSLRVGSASPSDTAFGQELRLKPRQWYCLSGWIRTEQLDPRGAPACATFQIQRPGGAGVVAGGRNHTGTNDWTQETIYFRPPDDGNTRVALFFVGYGKGTGTVWFDDLKLEEVDLAVSTLTVSQEPVCRGVISPFQYGQFIEYLCGLTPSMFAEKVFDGSFEGVPEYRVAFRKETDRIEQPWYPEGAVHRGDFSLDKTNPFNGKVSQRISQKPGDACTLGVSQGRMYVRQGEPLRASLFLRGQDVGGTVQLMLRGEGRTYATAEFRPGQTWQRFEALLTPSHADERATLTISFRGPGTVWIDQVSLMPTDSVFGWRRDVAEALKALKPGIIRFGGSTTEGFDWTATIGDPARRVPFTTCWGGLEPGNAGIEEFVLLCRWVEAEPLICLRFTGKSPKDAADQVEYLNGSPDSRMGALRAKNGHPKPYGVKYWQIGNELGDEAYQKGIAGFCKAMKQADPTIRLLASYPSPGLLRNAGQYLDYICPHHYGCDDLSGKEADVEHCRKIVAENAPGRDIRLGITEWNTTAGDWGLGRASLWTLDNALWCSRYHNLMHRHCDQIEIAIRSNLTDSFCSGIIQTNNHGLFLTPAYYAQQLYAHYAGRVPLRITLNPGIPFDAGLDCVATLSEDRRTVALFAVNQTTESQRRTIDVRALAPIAPEIDMWTLTDTMKAGERDAINSWFEPQRVRPERGTIAATGTQIVHAFPPLSLTVLKVSRLGQ